jgi:hypothetical protein
LQHLGFDAEYRVTSSAAQCADLADGFEPHLYTVESVYSAP